MKTILFILIILSQFLTKPYVLYCDRRYDDTEALQAWLDDKKVYYSDGREVGNVIQRKTFLITNTLKLHGGKYKRIERSFFEFKNMNYKRKYQGYAGSLQLLNNQECDQQSNCQSAYNEWRLNSY